jgi:chaperonin GroES
MTAIQPLLDRVFLVLDHADKVTESGLVVPQREIPNVGTVVAVGPGWIDANGNTVPLDLKPGDKVVFEKNSAYGTEVDGEKYVTVPSSGILAIVED